MTEASERALVLVVDDVEEDRVYLRAMLERAGYGVLVAEDAESGLHNARTMHPHLIVMDVQLPGISGLEATRRLKSDPLTARTPVIVVTGHVIDRKQAREARHDHVLEKPVNETDLLETIERLLREAAARG